jgi:hypothetical protein
LGQFSGHGFRQQRIGAVGEQAIPLKAFEADQQLAGIAVDPPPGHVCPISLAEDQRVEEQINDGIGTGVLGRGWVQAGVHGA